MAKAANKVTSAKARKMVAAGEGSYAYFAVGQDGGESRAKRTLEAAEAVYPEGGATIVTRLAVSCVYKTRSHVNAVGCQVYANKAGTRFIDIVG